MFTVSPIKLPKEQELHFNIFEKPYQQPLIHEKNYCRLDCHLLIGYFSANCNTEIDYYAHKATDCSFHIVPAKTPFAIQASNKDTGFLLFLNNTLLQKDQFMFSEGNADSLFTRPQSLRLDEERAAGLMSTIIEMAINCQSAPHLQGCAAFLLNYLLVEGQRNAEMEPDIVRQAETLITDHYVSHRKAQDYAEMLHVEASTLNKKLVAWRGKTITTLVHDMLLAQMKRQLATTNKEVKQIAYELQFDECSHFTRFFKHHTDMTPVAWRKKVKFGKW